MTTYSCSRCKRGDVQEDDRTQEGSAVVCLTCLNTGGRFNGTTFPHLREQVEVVLQACPDLEELYLGDGPPYEEFI